MLSQALVYILINTLRVALVILKHQLLLMSASCCLLIRGRLIPGFPFKHRDVSKSKLPLPLAGCCFPSVLWLAICHFQKDLRELSRFTGLQSCLSSCSHSQYGFFYLSRSSSDTMHTDKNLSVCVCSLMWNWISLYVYIFKTHSPSSSVSFLSSALPCSFSIPGSVLLYRGRATHTGNLRLCSGSVICTDKSLL